MTAARGGGAGAAAAGCGAAGESAAGPGTVALLVVSHSRTLAEGVRELAAQMAPGVRIATAAGAVDGGLGVDVARIAATMQELAEAGDVCVLADIGSSVMGTDAALELVREDLRGRVRFADAPLVEGAIAAAVIASTGAGLDAVVAAAEEARGARKQSL